MSSPALTTDHSTRSSLRDWGPIRIPANVRDLDGFRTWANSSDFPQSGRVSYIGGELFIDMSPEELETHNRVKAEVGRVIGNVNVEDNLGMNYADRTLLTNHVADLSTEPDGLFVTWKSLKKGRVRQVPRKGSPGQFIELEGSPDWALEIVSEYSEAKDTQELPAKYHRAEIAEFWLIDARGETIDFQILLRNKKGYAAAPKLSGWQRSKVFGRLFKLRRKRHPLGPWIYTLDAKK